MDTKEYNPLVVCYHAGGVVQTAEFENVNQAREFETFLRDVYGTHGFRSKFIYLEERENGRETKPDGPKGARGTKGSTKGKKV